MSMSYAARITALPCPMCGSAKVEGDFGDESACYRCRNCGCQSGRVYFTEAEREADDFSSSEEFALAAWNRRAADTELSALRGRVEELERALSFALQCMEGDGWAQHGCDTNGVKAVEMARAAISKGKEAGATA